MKTISERIQHIIDTRCDGNRSKFARDTGLSISAVTAICTRPDTGISSDTAAAILKAYPNLYARWLICNEGEAFMTQEDARQELQQLQPQLKMLMKQQQEMNEMIKSIQSENAALMRRFMADI